MADKETIILSRDVNIVTIPDGMAGMLRQGMEVTLHQALGDNFTVITDYGHMVRIAGSDADALGKEPQQLQSLVSDNTAEAIEQNCWEVMRTVYDPEIPVNIVELGLVYYCKVNPIAANQYDVQIMMTLTAPGCGMGPVIQGDVEKGIRALPGVARVNVEVVLDPPWSRDMMSEVAKLQLGLY
ncbi:MAG: putative Fe-S cluster assembly protein SufT [Methylovulum sp.]|uniref:putative Fe-S cluster assembly protein SufT n=1 Tax=Methylovulum sp. TaxID=1916980 RepID=UPI0026254E10|nr:putative Fe-S cluster assembly protein SufT [Methylovulum sp.]MDD2722510.1 putative Fe-S cluster assembly protein SufT [Methylovulum sp.]MDD5123038.1 putative Fe-S cluster assembly protein SufT [Methylovulum sp.]